jgi:hypothetical protein
LEKDMNDGQLRVIASTGLILGGVLGLAGTFAPSASLRGLAWGLDGVGLIVASAVLLVYYFRHGHDLVAAGFLVFAVGEGLILSGAALDPVASVPSFGAGASLWAAALALISLPRVFPALVRGLGLIAAALFAVVALLVFAGQVLSPLATPLPFYAYPFLVATLFGWAWVLLKARAPVRPGS